MTNLSDQIHIKDHLFKNRSVMAPMVPNVAGQDGSVTEEYLNFYLARARAHVGFIILGAAYVHLDGKGFERQLGIYNDGLLPGLENLVQSLSKHTRVGVQLSFKSLNMLPESFRLSDIREYRSAFVRAAIRARECGFDAVELHACHDYWLNYFLSPHFNHRSDAYGGILENRFRLLKETIDAVREAAGDALILGVRLSMDEFVEDGLTASETLTVGRWLENAGADYISASGGIGITQHRMNPPMEVERGSLLPFARALKQVVSIPVIGVGRLDRPGIFREAISSEHAELAAVARALVADPEYVAKTLEGRDKDIRPCVACNFCLMRLQSGEPLRCAVNPRVGRDISPVPPLKRKLKVVVVGGGPAGLSFAAHAALRGAEVKLYEKTPVLGGAINVGKRPPFKDVLQDLIDHLVKSAEESGVEIQKGREATVETFRLEAPDKIILATGAINLELQISGLDTIGGVFSPEEILSAANVASGRYLVAGGGTVGLETAEFLAEFRVPITLIEMTDIVGQGLHFTRLNLLLERIKRAGVKLMKKTRLISFEGKMAQVEIQERTMQLGPFDFIVFAVGSRSNRKLAEAIGNKYPVELIGDAAQPRSIYEAISEGFEAALNLK